MNDKEIVLTGNVKYGAQSVDEKQRMWTEVFSLVEVDGGLKMKAVHVYAVGSARLVHPALLTGSQDPEPA